MINLKFHKIIFQFLTAVLSIGIALYSFPDELRSEDANLYKEQPIPFHLICSRLKLAQLRKDSQVSEDQNRLSKLEEAANWLETAMDRFDYYNHPENEANTTPSDKRPPEPEFPDPNKSPLFLLDHLRLAYEAATQLSAQLMIQSVQYTRK